jgi:hypothetical protein
MKVCPFTQAVDLAATGAAAAAAKESSSFTSLVSVHAVNTHRSVYTMNIHLFVNVVKSRKSLGRRWPLSAQN